MKKVGLVVRILFISLIAVNWVLAEEEVIVEHDVRVDRVIIAWCNFSPLPNSTVEYWTDENEKMRVPANEVIHEEFEITDEFAEIEEEIFGTPFHLIYDSIHYYHAELKNLDVDTKYFYQIISIDDNGSVNPISGIKTFWNCTKAPSVEIISPVDGSTVSDTIMIEVEATQLTGIKAVSVSLFGEREGIPRWKEDADYPYKIPWDTTSFDDGKYTLIISVAPEGGRGYSEKIEVTVKNLPPDTTPPTVTITYPYEDQLLYGKVKIVAEATDDQEVKKVQFLIDGIRSGYDYTAPYERITNTGAYEPGPHRYQARAIDKAGNVGLSQVVNVNISSEPVDMEPPVITITYPEEGAFINQDVTLVYTVTDNISLPENITIIGDESPYTEEGEHRVVLTAIDEAQNEGVAKVNFTIDRTPPYTTHDYSYDGIWVNIDANITLTATDELSGVDKTYFTINDGAENIGTSISITAEGIYLVKFWSVDKAGNVETAHELSVKIDKTPPVTTATVTPAPNEAGWINTLPVNVTFTATDNLSEVKTTTPDVEITEEGIHEIKYSSTDNAGNVEAEKTITVNVDTTPPEVTISAEPSILWPVNKKPVEVTINGSATDVLSGVVSKVFIFTDEYNEVEVNLTDFGQTIELIPWRNGDDKDGRIYTIRVVATDKADNSTTQGTLVTVPHDMREKEKDKGEGKKK